MFFVIDQLFEANLCVTIELCYFIFYKCQSMIIYKSKQLYKFVQILNEIVT